MLQTLFFVTVSCDTPSYLDPRLRHKSASVLHRLLSSLWGVTEQDLHRTFNAACISTKSNTPQSRFRVNVFGQAMTSPRASPLPSGHQDYVQQRPSAQSSRQGPESMQHGQYHWLTTSWSGAIADKTTAISCAPSLSERPSTGSSMLGGAPPIFSKR